MPVMALLALIPKYSSCDESTNKTNFNILIEILNCQSLDHIPIVPIKYSSKPLFLYQFSYPTGFGQERIL